MTRWIVLFCRETELRALPYEEEDEAEARRMFEEIKLNWSDVYLCEVIEGPPVFSPFWQENRRNK